MTARELTHKDAASASNLMAAWIASGGAPEALDEPTVRPVPMGDEGLRAGNLTTNPWTCVDDGLHAVGFTFTPPGSCADDGLHAVGYTGTPRMCADDELQAGDVTGLVCS